MLPFGTTWVNREKDRERQIIVWFHWDVESEKQNEQNNLFNI